LDEKLYETLEDRIKEVQEASGMSWIEARFMKNAVEELSRCRYTLKWTYSMAFYLKSGNTKQIFEDLQALVVSCGSGSSRLTFDTEQEFGEGC